MNDRILLILKTQNLTSSQFADEIGVQRSNISHILSGRNNPSLEFVTKIIKRFPDLNLEWLIFGKGSMYKERKAVDQKLNIKTLQKQSKPIDLFSNIEEVEENFVENKQLQNQVFNPIIKKDENYSTHNELSENKKNIVEKTEDNSFEDIVRTEKTINESNKEVKVEMDTEKKKIEKIVIFYDDRTFREYFAE